MANVAQLVNNLHSLYLASGEKLIETPNYFVFDMLKTLMGARQMDVQVECGESNEGLEQLSVSASEREDGLITITLANTSITQEGHVRLCEVGGSLKGDAEILTLSHPDARAYNSFDKPREVFPMANYRRMCGGDQIEVPAGGIMAIRIQKN